MFVTVIVCPSVTERSVGENPKSTIVRSAPTATVGRALGRGSRSGSLAVLIRLAVGSSPPQDAASSVSANRAPSRRIHRRCIVPPVSRPHGDCPVSRARTVLRVGSRTGFASATTVPTRLPPWPSRRPSGATSTTRWCSRACAPAAHPASWPVRSTCWATRTTSPCNSSRKGRTAAATATRGATSAPVPARGSVSGSRRSTSCSSARSASPRRSSGSTGRSTSPGRPGRRRSCTVRTAAPSRRCCSGASRTARSTEP